MKDALGYYKILGITSSYSDEELKNAYHNQAKLWHPDSNSSPEAAEVFRKLSDAYKILSDNKLRHRYDILSLGCTADNYPTTSNLAIIKDGNEDVNLRALHQNTIRANFITGHLYQNYQAASYQTSLKLSFKNAITNWCLGWWHYKTFFANLFNIIGNFIHPISSQDSLRILLINMLAHEQSGQLVKAVQSGLQACDYLDSEGQKIVRDYIASLGINSPRPRAWNIAELRLVQLIFPLVFCLFLILSFTNLTKLFSSSSEINYYQNVNMGDGNQATDDLIVGKVINIPIDKTDASKLYHLKKAAPIMYGPSDKFDVLKNAPEKMTVRLTGITPDNIWARVLIDNGEMGFIRMNMIEKGRGLDLPFGSAVGE